MLTRTRTTIRSTLTTLALVVLLAACGGDGDAGGAATTPAGAATTPDAPTTPTDEATSPTAADTTAPATGDAETVEVATATTDLGEVLVDGGGMTLYVFDADTEGESTCYDSCAETWPPLVGEPTATGDVDASLLGTTERTDGSVQVTYAGMPLYHFAGDEGPGDTAGQGLNDIWWVIDVAGERITEMPTTSAGY